MSVRLGRITKMELTFRRPNRWRRHTCLLRAPAQQRLTLLLFRGHILQGRGKVRSPTRSSYGDYRKIEKVVEWRVRPRDQTLCKRCGRGLVDQRATRQRRIDRGTL
jgi:hypothetical protein